MPQDQQNAPQKGSKMSNVEWGLLIGAGFTIDFLQFILVVILIGPFVNWLIDLFTSGALLLIYNLKEVRMDKKKLATVAVGFVLDGLGIGVAPLWGLDIIGVMLLDKADKKLPKLPI